VKRFFALLVLLNVGVWMWGTWYKGNGEEPRRPRPPVNAAGMRLLSEPGVALTPRAPAQPQSEPLSRVQADAATPVCFSAGPFVTAEAAASLAAQLGAAHWSTTPRADEEQVESAYRVFLPPFASHKAAEAKRRELSRLGVEDHYLITEPDKKNAISLGVFSTREAAVKHAQGLSQRGVPVQVEALHHMQKRYWLDGQAPSAEVLQRWPWVAPVEATPRPCPPATPAVPGAH
jgi:hypothetical protein